MRAATLLFVVIGLAAVPPAAGAPEVTVYLEHSGHFRVGLGVIGLGAIDDGDPVPQMGFGAVNLERVPFDVNPCHRDLRLDIAYTPTDVRLGDADNYVSMRFEFAVELFDAANTRLASVTVRESGRSFPLPTVPTAGAYRLDVYLVIGAEVDYDVRVRGFPVLTDPACADRLLVNEVEANPLGWDVGAEWVELVNAGAFPIDLTGWRVRALAGQPQTAGLPAITLAVGERLVVAFDDQFLDNVDEVVVTENAAGAESDRTPLLTDTANDGRSWQRVPDAGSTWAFTTATRDRANA